MRRTWLLAGLLIPLCLHAQLRLTAVEGAVEKDAGESYSLGTLPAGDSWDTAFRLRNTGPASMLLHGLNVAGQGFTFTSLPRLPLELSAGGAVDFVVRFQPPVPGSYSAYLNVNGARLTILHGIASAAVTLLSAGVGPDTVVIPGQAIDFGAVEAGAGVTRMFVLANRSEQTLAITTIVVSGQAFRGPMGIQAPLSLKPGETKGFEIAFDPAAADAHDGALQLDQRQFSLRGTALAASFPKPRLVIDPVNLQGGQQAKISVRLSAAASASGAGQVTVEFQASVPGKAVDPAVLFPASGSRAISFSVAKGEDVGRFAGKADTEFQTGTTAGTLTFTVRLGSHVEQFTAQVASGPAKIDSVQTIRAASGLDVRVTGFDTSRSPTRLSFVFFDREGRAVAPGSISVDVGAAFREYFETAEFGGMFTVRAVFPVAGNVLQIIAVEVEITNSLGATRFPRTAIP